MSPRDIKGNKRFDDFDEFSKKVHNMTQRKFGSLLNVVPDKIETQSDLRNINAGYRVGNKPSKLYEKTKLILMNIDEIIHEAENAEIDKGEFSFKVEDLSDQYGKIRSSHKSLLYKLEDLLNWIEDDSLLSTILFHSKIADETVYSLSEEELKERLSGEETIEIKLEEEKEPNKEKKEVVKAIMLLSLEPLLVWATLYAYYVKNDYRFILRYETEVESAARVIRRRAPKEKVEKILREPA